MKPQEDEFLYESKYPSTAPTWYIQHASVSPFKEQRTKMCCEPLSTKGRSMKIGNCLHTEGIYIAEVEAWLSFRYFKAVLC
jgi:hypothetical protein